MAVMCECYCCKSAVSTPRALSIEYYPVESMILKGMKTSAMNVTTGRPPNAIVKLQ